MTDKKKHETKEAITQPKLAARLSENIKARRTMLKLTQAALAERLDIDTETLSRFERGKHLPSLTTLERLASVLETTAADLLITQAEPVLDDAVAISVWMAQLEEVDRAFVRDLIKFQCDHLISRKTVAGRITPRTPTPQPRKRKGTS